MAAKSKKGPSKALVQSLVEAQAIYTHSQGAPIKVQQRLHDQWIRLRNKVLDALDAQDFSSENQRELDRAAQDWWNAQAIRGAGRHW